MRRIMMAGVFVGWLFSAMAMAQTVDGVPTPTDYYQSALQSYLSGDFDQAILLDSKALQANSQDKKAQALLSILISEKDNANKTVIWIGGKPAIVESPPSVEVPAPVTIIQEKAVPPAAHPAAAGSKKLAELEARVQTTAFLMERDSFSQYRELTGAQVATNKKLEDINLTLKDLENGVQHSDFLFLLALMISGAALWKSWKNGQDIKNQKITVDHPPSTNERERVVSIRRS
ncbi:MAG TPA: hypothetical protein VK859_04155 [bacterium]|nr:hypothetical protein [bacterium]